jgi:hypothetical protein
MIDHPDALSPLAAGAGRSILRGSIVQPRPRPGGAEQQGRATMVAQTFYCPHCQRQLTKSAQAYVMGESMTTKGSHFVALGGPPKNTNCPGCGGEIDSMKMIMGEYDGKAHDPNTGGVVGFVVLAGLIAIAVYFIWFR